MNQEKKSTPEPNKMDPQMDQEKKKTQETEKRDPQMNQEKKNVQETEKMNPEFRNQEGQLLYCTERSGSKLQIKDAKGKMQFEVEATGPQGSTLNVKDAKGTTLGSCRIEPSKETKETEKETSKNTEEEPYKRVTEKV